ncbi:hypothetical protein Fmac_007415 [Flemingia macrophylla]|uniref:Uncharacterized protein n=1 Tax=Flemingia macrophylla TaxID=520843 RepID=A0ABD1MUH4_9FABA
MGRTNAHSGTGSRPDPARLQEVAGRPAPYAFPLNHDPPRLRRPLRSAVLRRRVPLQLLHEYNPLRQRRLPALPPLLHRLPILHHHLLLRRSGLVSGVDLHQQRRLPQTPHNVHHRLPHPPVQPLLSLHRSSSALPVKVDSGGRGRRHRHRHGHRRRDPPLRRHRDGARRREFPPARRPEWEVKAVSAARHSQRGGHRRRKTRKARW